MQCPNCVEKLAHTNTNGLDSYQCFYCEGAWVCGLSIDSLLEQENAEPSKKQIQAMLDTAGTLSTKRKCPDCVSHYLSVCKVQRVELDICSACIGVFFDKNEIEAFLPTTHKPTSNEAAISVLSLEGLFLILLAFFAGGA